MARHRGLALFGALLAVYAATLALPGRHGATIAPRARRGSSSSRSRIERDGDVAVADQYRDRAARAVSRRSPAARGAAASRTAPGARRPRAAARRGAAARPRTASRRSCRCCARRRWRSRSRSARRSRGGSCPTRGRPARRWPSACRRRCSARPAAIGPEPLGRSAARGRGVLRAARPRGRPAPAAAARASRQPSSSRCCRGSARSWSLAGLVVAAALVRWMLRAGPRAAGDRRRRDRGVLRDRLRQRQRAPVRRHRPAGRRRGPATGATGLARARGARRRAPSRSGATRRSDCSPGRPCSCLRCCAPAAVALAARAPGRRAARPCVTRRSPSTLCALACGAQLAVAVFLVRSLDGAWFPGLHVVGALPLAVPAVRLVAAPRAAGRRSRSRR